jgi:hypothetical protein
MDIKTHNGFITVHNPKTENHRTFRVWTTTFGKGDEAEEKRVVQLLTGPNRDDWTAWKSFGFVSDHGIRVWNKFRGTDHEKFAKILNMPEAAEKAGLVFMREARCRICNRVLTNPESIETGIGPICADR